MTPTDNLIERLRARATDPELRAGVRQSQFVAWDPEDLRDRSGEAAWSRSFSDVAPSLEAWLETWVGGKTQAEQHEEMLRQAIIDGIRQSRADFAAMTPQQRASYGLPEVGWEREIGGHLGFDEDAIGPTSPTSEAPGRISLPRRPDRATPRPWSAHCGSPGSSRADPPGNRRTPA